jgi:hypothetical protein
MRRTALVAHRVTLHGVTAEVVAPPALNATLRLVLAGYPDAGPGDEAQLRITVARVGEDFPSWEVSDGARKFPESTKRGSAAIRAEWLLVSEALKLWTHAVHVHAGLVGTRDRAALLIGRSGIGKSTTTMALGLAGLDVYTDDVALIERGESQTPSAERKYQPHDSAGHALGRGSRTPIGLGHLLRGESGGPSAFPANYVCRSRDAAHSTVGHRAFRPIGAVGRRHVDRQQRAVL